MKRIKFWANWATILMILIVLGCTDLNLGIEDNLPPTSKLELSEIRSRSALSKIEFDSTRAAEKLELNNSSPTYFAPQQSAQSGSLNYAGEAIVSAESTFPGYSVYKINDGNINTTVGPSYSWANNFPGGGSLPESVFLKFGSLKTLNKVNIYTSSGYELQNYSVLYRSSTNGAWVTLFSITGNTSVFRTHSFTDIAVLEVQIRCELGPNHQYIYGRLNEVELFGPVEPQLPPISVEYGMLVFNSQSDVIQTLDYLEFKYDQYDDAFLAQYPGLDDDQIAAVEEAIGYNDSRPYIDFELQFGIYSKRRVISAAEESWLASTSSEYPNQFENPDYSFIEDDEVRTIINKYGEVKVGSTYYMFNSDGTYYEVQGLYYNELVALRKIKKGDPLPPHVTLVDTTPISIIVLPTCRSSVRYRDFERNGDWRLDHITSIWNHPWRSRLMAKTKSYKKVGSKWKKKRATIGAQVWGNVKNNNCEGGQFLESSYVEKRRRKVKSFVTSGITIRANSGDVQSYHYSGNVGTFNVSLTW